MVTRYTSQSCSKLPLGYQKNIVKYLTVQEVGSHSGHFWPFTKIKGLMIKEGIKDYINSMMRVCIFGVKIII
jgi:hypothetical protein